MVPTFYRGVPVGNLLKVNRYTVPGSLVDVDRYRYSHGLNEANAVLATQSAIRALPISARTNPYGKALNADVYNVQLNGLGDTEILPDIKGGGPTPAGGTGWFTVLNTIVGNVSQGVACKISGACKPAVPLLPASVPGTSIPTSTVALVGGAGLLLFLLMRHRQAA